MRTAIHLMCAVVLLAAVAACGDGDGDGDGDNTSPPSTRATTTVATTAAPATTTTSTDTNSLADGSGCTPGSGELPDGRWFGYVTAVGEESVEFDLACWFSGEAAAIAAAEDGEESPPPNDYYVRNANTELRTVEVDDDADARWYPSVGDPQSGRTDPYDTWRVEGAAVTDLRPGFVLGVWLTVDDGEVTHVEEQWVP